MYAVMCAIILTVSELNICQIRRYHFERKAGVKPEREIYVSRNIPERTTFTEWFLYLWTHLSVSGILRCIIF